MLVADLLERLGAMSDWLESHGAVAAIEQRHLDEGTAEQAYWHLGYMSALADALELVRTAGAIGPAKA